jgi:hypothetical protein
MSTQVKSVSIVLTEKFNKEMEKFFEWASKNNYIIRDIDDEECEWSIELLSEFKEPSRNKLEMYIKSLFDKYTIMTDNNEINDAKLLSKEFKEFKPVKKSKKEEALTKKEKVVKEKKEKVVKEKKEKVVKEKKEELVKEKKEEEDDIKLDMSLDTSDTFYLDTLGYSSLELTSVFGKPKQTGKKDEEHVYEWKLEVNDNVYTIYDWENEENFENTKWHLGGINESKNNIKALYKYIDSMIVKKLEMEDVTLEIKDEYLEEENKDKVEKELFGDSEDDIQYDILSDNEDDIQYDILSHSEDDIILSDIEDNE